MMRMMMMMRMMIMVIMMMMSWFTWRRRSRVIISETAIRAAVAPVFLVFFTKVKAVFSFFQFLLFCCVFICQLVVRSMNSYFSVIDSRLGG